MRLGLVFAVIGGLTICVSGGARGAPQSDGPYLPRAPEPIYSPEPTETSPAHVRKPPPTPTVFPFFAGGTASAAAVRNIVGRVNFTLNRCDRSGEFVLMDDRAVTVTTGKRITESLTAQPAVVNALLLRAAEYVWRNCAKPYVVIGEVKNDFHYDVNSISVVDRDGNGVLSAKLGGEPATEFGDQPLWSGHHGYHWLEVRDLVAERATATAAVNAQMQDPRPIPVMRAPLDFFGGIWTAFKCVLAMGIITWLLLNWERLVRWFYELKPHPAKHMVDDAIYRNREIDGTLYKEINRPVFRNRIENSVRTAQASRLVVRLREHERVLRTEKEARLRAKRVRVERENASLRAHAELLRAGIDHEAAAASLDEIRKATRRHDD